MPESDASASTEKKKRKASGRGTVVKYRDGWAAAFVERIPDPRTGKRRRRYLYAKKKGEAESKLADALIRDAKKPVYGDDTERLGSYLMRWFEESVKPNASSATALTYESTLRAHVIPAIGNVKISALSSHTVQRLYARLRENDIGSRTVQKIHAVLHRAFASAVRAGLLDRNPASLGKDVPRYRAPEREPLTETQARALLEAARSDRFEALYVLALTTGARQGELFALRWRDLDVDKGELMIRRSLQDGANGAPIAGATKTRASRRRFALAPIALAALRAHRVRSRDDGLSSGDGDLIFAAENGEPIRRQNFLRRQFYPMLERAGLPKIHFHDLRHTAATIAAAKGTPVVAVAALLGHVDPTITLRTYQHAFEGAAGDASKRLGEALGRVPSGRKRRQN